MSDLVVESYNGIGAIDVTWEVDDNKDYELLEVSLTLNATASTSENFVIEVDAEAGAIYDSTRHTEDLSVTGVTSLVWQPDATTLLAGGDAVHVTWTNTDDRQYGLQLRLMRKRAQAEW